MIDPVTAIGLATTAFNTLKKGIAVGKDLQDMGSQLTQWAGAISDLDFAERQNAKPPWYKTLGGGVQAEAMEIFAAKKKAESMRKELKDYICVMYGPSHWDELLRIEADIRKQKKEQEIALKDLEEELINKKVQNKFMLDNKQAQVIKANSVIEYYKDELQKAKKILTTTAIPDPAFEQALIDLGYDTVLDGQVLTANINTIISLGLNDPVNHSNFPNVNTKITDLTGIEDFTALETLTAGDNNLTRVDFSKNLNLKTLQLPKNNITNINISKNLNLEFLNDSCSFLKYVCGVCVPKRH